MNFDLTLLPNDKILSSREVSELFGVSRQVVHLWQKKGLGGAKLIKASHRATAINGVGCLGWRVDEIADFLVRGYSARHLSILFRHFGL